MNLITFKPKGPVAGHDDLYNTGILGRRWVLATHGYDDSFYIGFEQQLLHKYNTRWGGYSAVWGGCISYFIIGLQKKFEFKHESDWYDGQHTMIHLGWFFINWSL